jgi:hypothetical protein
MPETTLRGQISGSGRCEFTLCFNGRMMLLFIEFENTLTGNIGKLSVSDERWTDRNSFTMLKRVTL